MEVSYPGRYNREYHSKNARAKYIEKNDNGLCFSSGCVASQVPGHKFCQLHLTQMKTKAQERRKRERLLIIEHYGGKCECCGEARYEFLAIDHINGGGNEERKRLGSGSGSNFQRWLIKQNFPPGYRILCHNCNQSMGAYGYCPHKNNPRADLSPLSEVRLETQ